MADTVAIVAITNSATLLAAGLTAFATHRSTTRRAATDYDQLQARLHHERTLHDIDELRDILDETGETMRRVRNAVAHPAGPGWVEEGIQILEPLEARLLTRLGPDEDAARAVGMFLETLRAIEDHYASSATNSEDQEDQFWDVLEAHRGEAEYQATQYFKAASAIPGARLALAEASV